MKIFSRTTCYSLHLVCSLSLLASPSLSKAQKFETLPPAASETPQGGSPVTSNELPEEAKKLVDKLNAMQTGNLERSIRQTESRLRTLQDSYTRKGKLEEAAAIRDAVLEMRARLANALTEPGSLTTLRGSNGQSFLIFITCNRGGSVWGNNPYTDDSNPGSAAIHAGLVFPGRKGFLKVTILPGRDAYQGIERNGVKSNDYARWEGSYLVEQADSRIRSGWDALPPSASRIFEEILSLKPTPDSETRKERLIARLKTLRDTYASTGKLDEALAVHEAIKVTTGQNQGRLPELQIERELIERR